MKNKRKILLNTIVIIGFLIIIITLFVPLKISNKNKSLNLNSYYQIQELNFRNQQSKGLLINDNSTNVVAITLIFKGGSALDALSKAGLTNLLTDMLLKGSGGISSSKFAAMLKNYGVNIAISVDFDNVTISMLTTKENINNAFNILNLMINKPNFDNSELDLVKNEALVDLKLKSGYTKVLAKEALYKAAFKNDPYFNDGLGDESSIKAINRQDLINAKQKIFTQNNLIVGVSGNISKQEVEDNINNIISKLLVGPNITADFSKKPDITDKIIKVNVNNATNSDILIAMNAPNTQGDDYYSSIVLNQYLGNGDLTSYLMQEVREKKGLVYTISSGIQTSLYGNLWVIQATTTNSKVDDTIKTIKNALISIKKHQYNYSAINTVKSNIEGNYFLHFTSNMDRSNNLAYMQLNQYTKDDIYNRNVLINKVDKDDINRDIDNYINPDKLLVVIAGGRN
ncbi:M16 family metallopeptidase [Rickettsiales bacterium LUAb2]